MSIASFLFLFLIYVWAVSIISLAVKINTGYNWVKDFINHPSNKTVKMIAESYLKRASVKQLKKMVLNPFTISFIILVLIVFSPLILIFDIAPELKKFFGYKSKLDNEIELEKIESEKNRKAQEEFMKNEGDGTSLRVSSDNSGKESNEELYYVTRGHHSPGTRAALILKRFKSIDLSINMVEKEIEWLREDFITDLEGIKYWNEVIKCIRNINVWREGNLKNIGDDIDPKEKFGFFDFELDNFKKGSLPYPHMSYAGVPECIVEVSEIVSISGMADNDGIPTEIIVNKHSIETANEYKRLEYKLNGMTVHKSSE